MVDPDQAIRLTILDTYINRHAIQLRAARQDGRHTTAHILARNLDSLLEQRHAITDLEPR